MVILKKHEIISYDVFRHNRSWSGLPKQHCKTLDNYFHFNNLGLINVYITGSKNDNIAFESKMLPVLLEGDNGVVSDEKVYYLLFSDEKLTQINKRFLLDDLGNKYIMKPVARCPYNYYSYPILELEKS